METKLVIPMWYGKATTYEIVTPSGEGRVTTPTPLVDAARAQGGVIWSGGPESSITYHLEDGYFVLDTLVSKASR